MRVRDDCADDERETDADRKGDGHAGDINGNNQQDVRNVEQDPAQEGSGDGGRRRGLQILNSGHAARSAATESEHKNDAEEEHTDCIVPVVE